MRVSICFPCFMVLPMLILGAFQVPARSQANASASTAPKAALPQLPEMWTALQNKLDFNSVKPGDAVRVQVSQSWVYLTCGINGGSMLEGKVEEVSAWTEAAKRSDVSVSFTAACGNGEKQQLSLIAIYYPSDSSKSQMDVYNQMPSKIGSATNQHNAMGRGLIGLDRLPTSGLSGNDETHPVAKIGEVKRISHLSLAVASGVNGSSAMASTDRRFRLEPGTRLILLPVPEQH